MRRGLVASLAGAAIAAPNLAMRALTFGAVHPVGSPELDSADAALVLGARVWEDGRPSRFLRERVETAATLYHSGLVPTLLLSGAGSNREGLDETASMRRTALELGVPDSAIVLDPDGVNTSASASHACEADLASVIVCSQEFHLPRAVWLCGRAGLDAQGAYPAISLREHTALGYVRETAASWKALLGEAGVLERS